MKKLRLFIFLYFYSSFVYPQELTHQIELTPFARMDWYPEFSYVFAGRASKDYVKIKGISWGINVCYKRPLYESFLLKVGLGYYRYSFNKMDNYNSVFGKSQSRIIDYPSQRDIIFATNRYWYNTITANLGIEKVYEFKNNIQILTGVNINNFYTFSQYYRITANYPTGPPNHNYKLKSSHYFGLCANIQVGVLKKVGKINIGPSIILPVFDLWKQDHTFPEEANFKNRNKWFRSVGSGMTFNFTL